MKRISMIVSISMLICCSNIAAQTILHFSQLSFAANNPVNIGADGGDIGPYSIMLSDEYEGDYYQARSDISYYIQEQGYDEYITLKSLSLTQIIFTVSINSGNSGRTFVISGDNGNAIIVSQQQKRPEPTPEPEPGPEDVTDGNWIHITTYTDDAGSHYRDITYYDGLGYPEQIIQVAGSPTQGKNIITPVWYDNMRRDDAKSYPPYVGSRSTAQKETDPITAQQAYYRMAPYYETYIENVYEASPLNRKQKSYNIGTVYRNNNKYSNYTYSSNAAGEVLILSVSQSGTLTSNGYYPAGALYKNEQTDEDGQTENTYSDIDGKIIMSQSVTDNGNANTYTVYDDKLRIRWIITPEGSALLNGNTSWAPSGTYAQQYCYIYSYDGKGRLTEKQIPASGTQYIIYDPAGRQVAEQDATLRISGKWILHKYDNSGHLIKEYLSASNIARSTIEAQFLTNPYPVIYDAAANTLIAEYAYGTTPAGDLAFSPVAGVVTAQEIYTGKTGIKTYEKIADLTTTGASTPTYIQRAYYYDYKGRTVQIVELNPLGGISRTSYKYDFTGNNLITHESHQTSSGGTAVIKQIICTYDNRNRLLSETATINAGTAATVTYGYDNLGKLTTKTYGNGVTETIAYNIQGWTTAQNAVRNGATIYTQQLRYYNPVKGTTALYNGNISEWTTTQGTNTQNTYDANGNMTTDGRKNLQITYNLLSLPNTVSQAGTTKAVYKYTADGTKYQVAENASANSNGLVYLGSLIYSKNGSTYAFESTDFGGGRIINNNGTISPYYYTTDHLGSIRTITNSTGTIVEQNDYYPFGLRTTTGNSYATFTANRYKYNGKEKQTVGNTGYIDYGARMYDEVIGKWGTVDPMAEIDYSLSPFRYAYDNPINYTDPFGLFETRKEARQYRRTHRDVKGEILKENDGSFSINDRKGGYTYYRDNDAPVNTIGLDNENVVRAALVTPYFNNENPLVSAIYQGQEDFLNHPITQMAVSTMTSMIGGGIFSTVNNIGRVLPSITYKPSFFTRSNLQLGQKMHRAYHAGEFGKEYNKIKGIRPDFVDFKTKTIYE